MDEARGVVVKGIAEEDGGCLRSKILRGFAVEDGVGAGQIRRNPGNDDRAPIVISLCDMDLPSKNPSN